jgi:hypothetical protein
LATGCRCARRPASGAVTGCRWDWPRGPRIRRSNWQRRSSEDSGETLRPACRRGRESRAERGSAAIDKGDLLMTAVAVSWRSGSRSCFAKNLRGTCNVTPCFLFGNQRGESGKARWLKDKGDQGVTVIFCDGLVEVGWGFIVPKQRLGTRKDAEAGSTPGNSRGCRWGPLDRLRGPWPFGTRLHLEVVRLGLGSGCGEGVECQVVCGFGTWHSSRVPIWWWRLCNALVGQPF